MMWESVPHNINQILPVDIALDKDNVIQSYVFYVQDGGLTGAVMLVVLYYCR